MWVSTKFSPVEYGSIEILDLPEIFRPIVPPLIRLIFDAFRSPTAFSLHAITDERQFELWNSQD